MKQEAIDAIALSVRSLSIDAIEKANSGHPGIPLGAAELAAVLYGEILKHNPKDSYWKNRDRFFMSAGHGSMWLYSILHLAGYDVTLNDIKNFRQVGSRCPGHPEYGRTDGVENTSGPLGQGVAMAVGAALAETMLAARFNTAARKIIDHYTYSFVGEGCLEEGISQEAVSLAGTWKLGKLIVFYDANYVQIDGDSGDTFSDNTKMRFESCGWQVLSGSMYEPQKTIALVGEAKKETQKPTLIILDSTIGKFSPKEGSAAAHGSPLGKEALLQTKKTLGIPADKEFFADEKAYAYFAEKQKEFSATENAWQKEFDEWARENPELKKEWNAFFSDEKTSELIEAQFEVGEKIATRAASEKALNAMAKAYKNIVGGSADLTGPNKVRLTDETFYASDNRKGRMIRFGVREFAMSAISAGMYLHGGLRPYCATFLSFSDYLRPSLRVAALMKAPVIYVFTHDSIFVGEDGPTHEPVEMLTALRAIPNVRVIRPGDAEETMQAWKCAYAEKAKPVCLILSRQNLSVYKKDDSDWKKNFLCGAYIVQKGNDAPDVTILASGSEVEMALEAAKLAQGKTIRIVSVPDVTVFSEQSADFRKSIIGNAKRVVAAEAGRGNDWRDFVSSKRDIFSIERFGESGPAAKVAEYLHFTAEELSKLL